MIARRRFHRAVFCAAGAYNIAWGLYSALDPQWLFRFSGLPLQNHPQVFACLGMVVGLYGVIYFEVARAPERGWLLAAVGLTGKVLGPLGLARLIYSGARSRAAGRQRSRRRGFPLKELRAGRGTRISLHDAEAILLHFHSTQTEKEN